MLFTIGLGWLRENGTKEKGITVRVGMYTFADNNIKIETMKTTAQSVPNHKCAASQSRLRRHSLFLPDVSHE